jgi:hypothetical protein
LYDAESRGRDPLNFRRAGKFRGLQCHEFRSFSADRDLRVYIGWYSKSV